MPIRQQVASLYTLSKRRISTAMCVLALLSVILVTSLYVSYTDLRNTSGGEPRLMIAAVASPALPVDELSYRRPQHEYTPPTTTNDDGETENVPYESLASKDKIGFLLNEVATNKTKYWMAHTELTDYKIQIDPREFSKEACKEKYSLFYDPRFTLAVVLSEIKRQYARKNPDNHKSLVEKITIPFSWSDWVDLTDLNPYILDQHKFVCSTLAKEFNQPAKDPTYCKDVDDISDKEVQEVMGFASKKFLPVFCVRDSPQTIATNKVRILEAKSHLLTYAINPINLIFLTKNGTYEAFVDKKQRIVDSDMFEDYLRLHKYRQGTVIMDPVEEFVLLLNTVPADTSSAADPYGMVAALHSTDDENADTNVHIPEEAFQYQQTEIDSQIKEFETGFVPDDFALDAQHQQLFYNGLKLSNQYSSRKEPTYFKLARLKIDANNPKDHGWHYEWRFFNGALRYVKPGWTNEEMMYREKIILDRILKNWFRFAQERGILSWISHGPLLSWYWDGLLFPYDEDIDIQMPARELVRFLKLYNQTLVVEDVAEGFGKYFIDCGTFLHHRGKSYNDNHIDARFIDVDTGSYIDITGLGISEERLPGRFKNTFSSVNVKEEVAEQDEKDTYEDDEEEQDEKDTYEDDEEDNDNIIYIGDDEDEVVKKADAEPKVRAAYNCRNLHFYAYDDLQPLRLSSIANTPAFVPQKLREVLVDEYSRGLIKYEFMKWYFVDAINLWVHREKLRPFLDPMLDMTDETETARQIQTMGYDQILGLLESHRELLLEYYLTKELTDVHREEMLLVFETTHGKESTMRDWGKQRSREEIDSDPKYRALRKQFIFKAPITRPLFNFERIDREKFKEVEEAEIAFVKQRDAKRKIEEDKNKIAREKLAKEKAAKDKAAKEKEKAEQAEAKLEQEKAEKAGKAEIAKAEKAEKEDKEKQEKENKEKQEKENKEKEEKEQNDDIGDFADTK